MLGMHVDDEKVADLAMILRHSRVVNHRRLVAENAEDRDVHTVWNQDGVPCST
jgi:hypothetical protein